MGELLRSGKLIMSVHLSAIMMLVEQYKNYPDCKDAAKKLCSDCDCGLCRHMGYGGR